MSQTVLGILVWLVVALHVLITLIPPLGGFLVWRWRRLFWPHMAFLVWAASVPILQLPCPLTDLEKGLRRAAGMPVYESHFIAHYVYRPLAPRPWLFELFMISTPILSYSLLAQRRRRAAGRAAAAA